MTRSGFVALAGRPNVGKSTLVNALVGRKVAIVSDKPQTTRHRIQGVLNRPGVQVVFVDTPGLHKPRTALGERLNEAAQSTIGDVDVVVLVLDATQPFGRGDAWVAERVPRDAVVVVNKLDVARREQVVSQLSQAGELDLSAYFPVSARTGEGVGALVEAIVARLPEGPPLYPDGELTDEPEETLVAELIREAALEGVRDELPHSIAVVVQEMIPHEGRDDMLDVHVTVYVERPSQKGIVIGKGGARLKEVGTTARRQIEALLGTKIYLDLHVSVAKDWQRDPKQLRKLGF